jgi:hypothetical protein
VVETSLSKEVLELFVGRSSLLVMRAGVEGGQKSKIKLLDLTTVSVLIATTCIQKMLLTHNQPNQ